MRRFAPEFIEQVRLANDIADIIGDDTFLKPVGSRYMGLCPFPAHNEKTPSFSLSPDKQVYHCFGCGESGNIFTYLQVQKGLHFMEAVKFLARRAGLPLPQSEEKEDQKYEKWKSLLEINRLACDFYQDNLQNLPASHLVKKYLHEREFSEETIKTFQLGCAPEAWDKLLSYLKKQNANLSLAEELGLIKRKKDHCYDLFRGRLIFPVFAKNGRDVLGFGGRILTKESDQPKYINSPDSLVFHKGRNFYGLQKSAGFIRESGKVLVVEGYTDYLSLYQRGVRNVTATLGTALTEEHARLLALQAGQVILFFDGDQAGQKAMIRSLGVLLSAGPAPKMLKLKEGQDPDSFIRAEGAELLRKKMDSAKDLFLYLFLEELKKHPVGVDRLSLIQKMAGILARIKNPELKSYYINRFLDSFGFDEQVARSALSKALKAERSYRHRRPAGFPHQERENTGPFSPAQSPLSPGGRAPLDPGKQKTLEEQEEKLSLVSAPKAELSLLILSLENPDYYAEIKNSGVMEYLSHSGIIRMFKLMQELGAGSAKRLEPLTQALSAYLRDPRELNRDKYPSLTCLSPKKAKIFIQDCAHKVEEDRKQLNLKGITARMRLDGENPEKYLLKIAEWTKSNTEQEI